MQQYDFNTNNGASFPIASPGRYIKYLAGNNGGGDVSLVVTPQGQGATKVVLVPGQAFRLGGGNGTPPGWVLTQAVAGTAITGKVVIGDGQIDDPTINGVVQVVDGGKARTLSNNAFAMFGNNLGSAGTYARVQLWNPANSGKRLVVESLTPVSGGSAQSMAMAFNTAALATLIGAGISKMAGGTAGAGVVNGDTTATSGSAAQDAIWFQMAANSNQQYKMVEPIVLPPGYGLLVWSQNPTTGLGCTFEWYEEPNV